MRELADGVTFWRSRWWPSDFHNAAYEQWAQENPNGDFTLEWWKRYQLPRLTRWIATRPYSGAELTSRFIEHRTALSTAWERACVPYLAHDISTVAWAEVGAFPNEVAKIKPTKHPSPVFTSKFCHFLLPRIFPVVDNAALGGRWETYEAYFTFVQDEWTRTDSVTRSALVARLVEAAQVRELFSGFPVINKITELRLIGRRHRSADT
jgi:hypothetical protein